jgi:serine/threonine protein kinase
MNPRAKEIFLDALDVPAEERRAFVEKACGNDADLMNQVRGLLEAHGDAAGMFHRETATLGVTTEPATPRGRKTLAAGDVVGRYTLKTLLGEGGFGSVFLAQQSEPIVREVAFKVLRASTHIEEIVTRFDAERQVLALMEHPGIARVYDAGTTDDGRPFIAMEYVDGLPITDYANKHLLNLRQRLALFADVCSAVQHAHQKGIIHRDLKPTNILVTTIDGIPVPKVIDFGIAKAIDPETPVSAAMTQEFQIIGTPQYMAPEQAVAGAKDVDTRSDVYSLGTVLYELVAGAPPFDIDRLKKAGLEEICRLIREETPLKPSTRLSSIANTRAGQPGTTTQTLGGSLDREVDWIVMRALEKDRTRRYQSPADLAADIERHLRHEAIVAGPPSRIYQLRKFVRRNRITVAAAAVVAIALVAATAISSVMYVREARAERRALENAKRAVENEQQARLESDRATAAEKQAVMNEQKARKELQRATVISDFTTNLLAGIKPQVARGRDPALMKDLLTRALETSTERLRDNPDLNLIIRTIISEALYDLGDYQQAYDSVSEAVQKATDAPAEDRWRGTIAMAEPLIDQGKVEEAEKILAPLAGEVERAGKLDTDVSFDLQLSRINLANNNDQFEQAEQMARELIARLERLGKADTRFSARAVNALAISMLQRNQNEQAAKLFIDNLPRMKRIVGEDDPLVINVMGNLGAVLMDLQRYDEAKKFHREALDQVRRLYSDDHPVKLTMMVNFAYFLTTQKEFDEAVALLQEAESKLGKLDPFSAIVVAIKSQAISTDEARGRWDLATKRSEDLLQAYLDRFGNKSPRLAGPYSNVLRGMVRTGRADEALKLIRSLGDPPLPPDTGGRMAQAFFSACGQVHLQLGQIDEARAALAQALSAMNDDLGVDGKPFRVRATTELEKALAAHDRGEKVDFTAPTTQPTTKTVSP